MSGRRLRHQAHPLPVATGTTTPGPAYLAENRSDRTLVEDVTDLPWILGT
jgi:hypothetical protein